MTEFLPIIIKLCAFLIAIIGHEIMHGFIALTYGDSTARDSGRLSVNPIKHIDPLGSLILPGMLYFVGAPFLFGWAKPVPVNMYKVIKGGGYFGAIAVSSAGVVYNFLLAIVCSFLLVFVKNDFLVLFLRDLIIYNVVLGVFNLWMIPPLDGANIVRYIELSFGGSFICRFYDKIERYGIFILMIILSIPNISSIFFYPVRLILQILI